MVDALVEAGSLTARQRLAIVLTKKDAVAASPYAERVCGNFDEMVAGIRRRQGDRVAEVASFVVAASPRIANAVKRGEGVDALLEYWMRPTAPEPLPPAHAVEMARMIDRIVEDGEDDA